MRIILKLILVVLTLTLVHLNLNVLGSVECTISPEESAAIQKVNTIYIVNQEVKGAILIFWLKLTFNLSFEQEKRFDTSKSNKNQFTSV